MFERAGNHIRFDRLLSILAFLTGLTALYFSWEANRIARENSTPSVVVLLTSHDPTGFIETISINAVQLSEADTVMCTSRIRLSNSGGASTALTNYTLIASSIDTGELISYTATDSVAFAPAPKTRPLSNMVAYLVRPESRDVELAEQFWGGTSSIPGSGIKTEYLLPMPAPLPAESTLDLHVRSVFTFDRRIDVTSWVMYMSSLEADPNRFAGYQAFDVTYVLQFASGEYVYTEAYPCFYFHKG